MGHRVWGEMKSPRHHTLLTLCLPSRSREGAGGVCVGRDGAWGRTERVILSLSLYARRGRAAGSCWRVGEVVAGSSSTWSTGSGCSLLVGHGASFRSRDTGGRQRGGEGQ